MPFSLSSNPSIEEISDALNYILSNFGSNVSIDPNTGVVSGPTGQIGYYYRYLFIKYATSFEGTVGFSNSPTNALYFGTRNSNSNVESNIPSDYIWNKVTGGFGTTKFLWYSTSGGRQVSLIVNATAPGTSYLVDPGTAIDLDVITNNSGSVNTATVAIYYWTTGPAPARPSTTSTYTWATGAFTPPSGWSVSIPSNTTNGDTLWAIYIPLKSPSTVLTAVLDWTNTSYPIVQVSKNGSTGGTGINGTRTAVITMFQWAASSGSLSAFPSGNSTYTWATGTFTLPSTPYSWTILPGASVAGYTLFAVDAIYSDNLTSATSSIPWTTSVAYPVGASGVNGNRTAFLQMYQWAASTPTSFPSGTSTYTWATASYTAASSPNGWTLLPGNPVAGYLLYAIDQVYSDNLTTATTTVTWSSSSPYPIGSSGANGDQGLSSITCYLVQNQATFAPSTPANTTGPTAPSGWTLVAPSVSIGDVLWYSFGQYNPNATTVNGVPAGQTKWGAPTAASVFQDIRSDNWNGGTPPISGPYSPLGTAGYYIQRSTGVMYLNSVLGRGVAEFDGYNAGPSGYSTAILANKSLNQNAGVEAYTNNTFISSGALRAYNTASGFGNAIYAVHNGSGSGLLAQSGSGIAIIGTGATGIQGSGGSYGVVGTGVYGVYGTSSSGAYAMYANGYYGTNNSTLVTNLYSDFSRSLVGTSSNQLRFVSGTSTGSGVATFASTNKPGSTTTNVWMTIQIDSTTLYIPVWT